MADFLGFLTFLGDIITCFLLFMNEICKMVAYILYLDETIKVKADHGWHHLLVFLIR